MIDREMLERERAGLRTQERKLFAEYQATVGALQFCEFLLKESHADEPGAGEGGT